MYKFYSIDVIQNILKSFKVNNVVLLGLKDENLLGVLLEYCDSLTVIDLNKSNSSINVINENPLNCLPNFDNYEAIFIDDDPNWYTVFNELNIIKETNNDFPLVFICNNRFPHKYRDSYSDLNRVPDEFKHECSKELPICYNDKKITIYDGYYHACEGNTSKNGVSTAIDDFLKENQDIGVMDLKFIEEIVILYPKSTISTIRIDNFKKEISGQELDNLELSDKLLENQLLFAYINEFNIEEVSKNAGIISDYNNKIQIHDSEIEYKNSQLGNMQSKLHLKDSQIDNFKSILVNKENEIGSLQDKLRDSNYEISSLKNKIIKKESELRDQEANFNNQISIVNNEVDEKSKKVNSLNNQILFADNKINTIQNELDKSNNSLNFLKKEYTYQNSKLTNQKYCISCFKDEISNNKLEIEYLQHNVIIKKILAPFSYVYLILKSKPKEISINFKLFKALKNSNCFNIGFYLRNNEDIQKSNWCKFFSPELHYVCNGFSENRKFNKKYFNTNSKKELLDYLLTCENK